MDEASCTFGTVSAKGEYCEKSNFFLKLEMYVDGDNAGYFAYVTRKSDGEHGLLKIILVGFNFYQNCFWVVFLYC